MNRRRFLDTGLGAAALAFGPSLTSASAQGGMMTLKDAGAACHIKVGGAGARSKLERMPGYKQFFVSNFNLLAPEAEMKWYTLHPAPDKYVFTDADWLVKFCQQNGMLLRGHNLCWNTANPDWVKNTVNRSNAQQILEQHIQTVAGRYAGQIDSWDVVNEPIGFWFGRPDGLYVGPWLNALGPEYIDIAFHKTAQVDPKATRVLNIHNVEHSDSDSEKARQFSVNLVTALVKRNVPIQAVGLESHLDAGRPWDPNVTAKFVRTFRDMGLQVLITELDVNDTKITGDAATRDKAVADLYNNYLSTVMQVAQISRIVLWTPTDKSNWMDYMNTNVRWKRTDNDPKHRPGVSDENLQPKMAYSAVVAALRSCHT